MKNIIVTILLVLTLAQCKDPYTSPATSPATGYLVVEGFIAANGPTQFLLSRTIPLSGNATAVKELNAVVQVEAEDNTSWLLADKGNGVYSVDTLPLNSALKYRLRIHTTAGKDYASDFVTVKPTPAIDSVNWLPGTSGGVDIFANAHDVSNNTRYYQWDYTETWHYTAAEYSSGVFTKQKPWVVTRLAQDQIYDCWKTRVSTNIILATTGKLVNDVVYRQLLVNIPQDAQQLSDKYSILVHQYALTEDAYNYLSLMQKNTESLGSIFDAQPSALKGNIHNLSDAKEQVIGFVSAGTAIQQRIFIKRSDLKIPWNYYFMCQQADTVVKNDSAIIWSMFGTGSYVPLEQHFTNGMFDGWTGNGVECVDCRAQGGTTTRPSFWIN